MVSVAAVGAALVEKNAILYRIGLPPKTATPLALFGGRPRIEIRSSSIPTNMLGA